jgi:hypothetical protein
MGVPRNFLKENGNFFFFVLLSPYLLFKSGMTAITLVTHEDTIPADKKEAVLAAASRATGSPGNQTFFISNYTIDDCPRYTLIYTFYSFW